MLESSTVFETGDGAKWTVRVDVGTIRRVLAELPDVDLSRLTDQAAEGQHSLLQRLQFDDVLLVDVISLVLTPQIRERGMTGDEFANLMLGEGIALATDALIAAVINFTRPQRRGVIAKAWLKSKSSESFATKQIADRLDSLPIEEMTKRKVNESIDQALTKHFGDSLASPASPAPTPIPSAN